ncbi:hypothetical protein niasHS_003009 [Heterodera schachtii]|uniref:Uncharacterized protein n=1 Tax=Heterodera schachtii TaxID=97005 RepID=A0ABD2K9F5_HETSC
MHNFYFPLLSFAIFVLLAHFSDATNQKFLGGAHGNDVDNLDAPKQHILGGVGGDKQLKPEDARPRRMRGAWPWIPPRNNTNGQEQRKFLGGAEVETVVAKPEDARPRRMRGAWPWVPPRNNTNGQEQRKFLGGAETETVVIKPPEADDQKQQQNIVGGVHGNDAN